MSEIVNYYGNVILGSTELQTSVSEEEIVPSGNKLLNFEFINDSVCTVLINNSSDAIYVRANVGLKLAVVNSFKIVENGIQFTWIAQKG